MPQEVESLENNETSIEAQQVARTKLRESYLKVLNYLSEQPCNILTYEKTNMEATFVAWNPDTQDVLVRDLMTPANICIKSALLRSTDILSIQFDTGRTNSF